MQNDIVIRRDSDDLMSGRLVALPTLNMQQTSLFKDNNSAGLRNTLSFDFPAMPEVLELARSTDYVVEPSLVTPDGIHQYRATKPLEIPVEFSLHAFDETYCRNGALTLIQLAARLHSFVLPISTYSQPVVINAPSVAKEEQPLSAVPGAAATGGKPADGTQQQTATKPSGHWVESYNNSRGGIFSPVTCYLDLISTGNRQMGIAAVGYVKDVRVRFKRPWLRARDGAYNLPSQAEFSFTFVHVPSHGNAINDGKGAQDSSVVAAMSASRHAYADDVREHFYHTRHLVEMPNYQGFRTNPSGEMSRY